MNLLTLSFTALVLTFIACGVAGIHMDNYPVLHKVGLVFTAAASLFWLPWVWKLVEANLVLACG